MSCLRDFNFAYWRFLRFARAIFLRLELTEIYPGNLTSFCGFLFQQRDIKKEGNVIFSTFITLFR